jgi:hypothetical protein
VQPDRARIRTFSDHSAGATAGLVIVAFEQGAHGEKIFDRDRCLAGIGILQRFLVVEEVEYFGIDTG